MIRFPLWNISRRFNCEPMWNHRSPAYIKFTLADYPDDEYNCDAPWLRVYGATTRKGIDYTPDLSR